MSTCLFVIDVQNGFVSENTEFVLKRIRQLLEGENPPSQHVIFTQFVNVEDSPYRKFLDWHHLSTPEEQNIHSTIRPFVERIFTKETYSALTPNVLSFLEKHHQIDTALLSGIDTDCCVLATAIDLFELSIQPVVLEKYCASNGGKESHLSGIKVLERLIGKENIHYGLL